ncbi:MAG: hypothetical protein KJP03_03525, partial [Gammaproteobacteria bacterium]|nr:hypothetical protein [Gammaproteobacteria bacterium]
MKYFLLVLMSAAVLAACSKKDEGVTDAAEKMTQDARQKVDDVMGDNPPQSIEEAIQRVGDALSDGEQSVSVGELKALLPDELIGLKRTSHEAERVGFGIKVSKANATYGDEDERLSLMITDLGGAGGLATMGRELFETEVDREDENGFERTTTYKGHKSFQRMQSSGKQSIAEIMVFVDDRFTVQLDGQNVSFKQMTKA